MPFETENRAVHIGLAEKNAGVVHKIAGWEIICAIDDDIVILEQLEGVRAGQLRFDSVDLNVGIEIRKPRAGGLALGLANIASAKSHLALKIREIHHVKIDKAQFPDTCSSKIQTERRAQTACADEQNLGIFQLELPLHANLGHDEMAAVAQNLFFRKPHHFSAGLSFCRCCHCDSLSFFLESSLLRGERKRREIFRFARNDGIKIGSRRQWTE